MATRKTTKPGGIVLLDNPQVLGELDGPTYTLPAGTTREEKREAILKAVIEDEILEDYLVTHDLPIHSQINLRKFKAKAGEILQLNKFEYSVLKHYVIKAR